MLPTPITKKAIDNLNRLSILTNQLSEYEWDVTRLERNLKELDELEPEIGRSFDYERRGYNQALAEAKRNFIEAIEEWNQLLQNSVLTINEKKEDWE